ncbi:helix-turn-helix domain-containing protein [Daejeonia sp. YH14]|uniref:helix-turn-helix domain-containing protein n=1 Tax=Daejeonia sp. YH14 TaxID=3439042 RepID=UPI003F49329E
MSTDSYASISKINSIFPEAEKKGDNNLISMLYCAEGFSYYLLTDNESARKCYIRGMFYGKKADAVSGWCMNSGFWGFQMMEMGMKKSGTEQIEEAIHKMEDHKESDEFANFVLGVLFNIRHIDKSLNTKEKLYYLGRARTCFEKVPSWQGKNDQLHKIFLNTALVYIDDGNFDNALHYINLSTQYCDGDKDLLYYTYAVYYMGKKDYQNAIKYANNALKLKNNNLGLVPLYEILEDANKGLGNYDLSVEYADKTKKLKDEFSSRRLSMASELYESEYSNKKQLSVFSQYLIIGGSILLMFLLYLFVFQQEKCRLEQARFADYKLAKDRVSNRAPVSSNLVSDKAECHILKKLNEFERTQFFLEKGYNMTKLSTFTNSNVRYLSEVIKKHKAENFNNYINQLRITFVTNQLEENPDFLKFKISYLADVSGFSSAAAFTKTFSSITGLTPSAYITLLKKEIEK